MEIIRISRDNPNQVIAKSNSQALGSYAVLSEDGSAQFFHTLEAATRGGSYRPTTMNDTFSLKTVQTLVASFTSTPTNATQETEPENEDMGSEDFVAESVSAPVEEAVEKITEVDSENIEADDPFDIVYMAALLDDPDQGDLIDDILMYQQSTGTLSVYQVASESWVEIEPTNIDVIILDDDTATLAMSKIREAQDVENEIAIPLSQLSEEINDEYTLAHEAFMDGSLIEEEPLVAAGNGASATRYTSAQRSQDARKQVRSTGGKFINQPYSDTRDSYRRRRYGYGNSGGPGAGGGGNNATTWAEQNIRCYLPEGLTLVTNPLVYIQEKLENSAPVSMVAAGDLFDDNRVQVKEAPKALYLASVTQDDPRKCYTVLAVVKTADGDFNVFTRFEGQWNESVEQKDWMKSMTPPHYVDLTDDENVLSKALSDLDATDNANAPVEEESPEDATENDSREPQPEMSLTLPEGVHVFAGYKTNRDGNYTSDERSRKAKSQDRGMGGKFQGNSQKNHVTVVKGNGSTVRFTLSPKSIITPMKHPVSYIREWLNLKPNAQVHLRRVKDFISYFVPEEISAEKEGILYGAYTDPEDKHKIMDVIAFAKDADGNIKAWLRKDGMWRESTRFTKKFEQDKMGDNFAHLDSKETVKEAVLGIDTEDSKKYTGKGEEKPEEASVADFELEPIENVLFDEFGKVSGKVKGHTSGAMRLKNYWAFDPRGVAKWRPGTPGDLTRLHRHLAKYVGPSRAWGLSQTIHMMVFGRSNYKRDH